MNNSLEYLDSKWFSDYLDIAGFSEINFLTPEKSNYNKEKEKFLSGKVNGPCFSYNLDQVLLKNKKVALKNLQEKIGSEEDNTMVQTAYIQTIAEKLQILELLEATIDKDDSRFTQLSEQIYGKPDSQLYQKALGILSGIIEKYNCKVSNSFKEIIFDAEKNIEFDFNPISASNIVTATDLKVIFDKKIKELESDFAVKVTETVASITVKYSPERQILIPKEKTWNQNIAKGLIAHEIDVHVRRSENGNRSPLKLLGVGLFQYLKGEEGLAMYLELEKNKSKLPGIGNYLTVALMQGLHNKGPLDFHQVFDFMYEYNLIMSNLAGKNLTEDQLKSKSWEGLWRVARGTTGQSLGSCLTRDIIYFKGFNEVKDIIEMGEFPYDSLFLGKYDPANKKHLDIINTLKI